ncbi:MAG TPA: DUF6786 family protein [Vicinamibacteria bacterium]|nr:DUF6786 family protein [Vicinamibacteria bacterium]
MEIFPATAVLGLALLAAATAGARGFEEDLAFLRRHVNVLLLQDGRTGARVVVVPAWQGRVMTSATGDGAARGYGWINEELIASRQLRPHINAFGGEDRLWLGPEGGQFSIFFRKGDPFDLDHWQTPPLFDTEPWAVVEKDARRVALRHRGRLVNYTGTPLDAQIDRTVRLLDREAAAAALGGPVPEAVRLVAFASENTLTNAGPAAWARSSGLLSLWILGMFQPSPTTTIVVPYREGKEAERGKVVNDAYFGKVPADRLVAGEGVLFFSGDGRHRSKIGLSPRRARPLLGSYDAERGVLTIVSFDRPEGATEYVNSMWEIQKEPFAGDVVNSYNDGPPSPGAKPMGPFYELETSSPAAALAPGASLTHVHRTFHLEGGPSELDALARRLLGVGLERIRTALPPGAR